MLTCEADFLDPLFCAASDDDDAGPTPVGEFGVATDDIRDLQHTYDNQSINQSKHIL